MTTTTTVVKTNGNIDEIFDEEILKKLVSSGIFFLFETKLQLSSSQQLEQATSYEERRKIRARIKQVMADKEGEY